MQQGLRLTARCAWLMAGLVVLSGCARLGASAEERINQAVPPSIEVQAAKSSLDRFAQSLTLDPEQLETEYQARLKGRALECGRGYAPSLWTSDEAIRTALVDGECFRNADDGLREWVGFRHIALLLAAPPLRPVPDAPSVVLAAAAPI